MEMRNIDDVFARLGMPKHAGRIYRVLEKDGPLLATDLIRISGTHRPAAYRALAALEQSKLAIKTKSGKRRLWSAADPKRIEALFGRALRDASSLLPDTLARTEESVTASLKLFHGPEGIRAVFDDVIDHTPR
ncbi:MAG TPA: hypothetical protein VFT82_03215, partial [Candidatus Paceibacterota bacterium]|nr:hypothetical protein [Candidatus Paceibacterota bacterium]